MSKTNPLRDTTIIFTDGACSGNPGRGGWGAIIATPDGHVTELGGGDFATTNNKMELTAIIEALKADQSTRGQIDVYTDSTYVIRGITQWIWGWIKNGWKSSDGGDVSNQELWKELSRWVAKKKKLTPINWKYVRGHTGVPGNERCDEIAVAFTAGKNVPLYNGSLLKYDVAIYDIPDDTSLPEMRPKTEKAKALSYLSLIGSVPMRHSTWAECERRVKGQSGAKFKKAMSSDDEEQILKSWGIDPKKLKS